MAGGQLTVTLGPGPCMRSEGQAQSHHKTLRSAIWHANMQGCELVVDILLTRKGGRPSGEAFVVLGAPYQVEAALQRNKSYLGRRYVEVFKSHKHVRTVQLLLLAVVALHGISSTHHVHPAALLTRPIAAHKAR